VDRFILARLEEVRRQRGTDATWQGEYHAAKKRMDDWSKQATKPHGTAARHAKVGALKIGDDEKALLISDPDNPQAKHLAKKFSKELKVENKDCRPFLSDEERAEWDARAQALKTVEERKPKPLPAALDFARRVEKEAGGETEARVRLAWRPALGREPASDELDSATAFVNAQIRQRSTRDSVKTEPQQLALADLCQAIFALNEFIYVD